MFRVPTKMILLAAYDLSGLWKRSTIEQLQSFMHHFFCGSICLDSDGEQGVLQLIAASHKQKMKKKRWTAQQH